MERSTRWPWLDSEKAGSAMSRDTQELDWEEPLPLWTLHLSFGKMKMRRKNSANKDMSTSSAYFSGQKTVLHIPLQRKLQSSFLTCP